MQHLYPNSTWHLRDKRLENINENWDFYYHIHITKVIFSLLRKVSSEGVLEKKLLV